MRFSAVYRKEVYVIMKKNISMLIAMCVVGTMALSACGSSSTQTATTTAEIVEEETTTVQTSSSAEDTESEETTEAETAAQESSETENDAEAEETEAAEQASEASETGETSQASDTEETSEEETTIEVPTSENGEITLEDYSTIEINEADVTISDESVDSYIDSIISYATTTETVTEGTAEDGDTVNIAYSGVLEGEEEVFDSTDSYDLTLGSGTFIDGFEEQVVGHEIGETFDINVTFPEDYSAEEYAGKNATFTITINSKSVSNVPELNDEFVKEFSAANMDTELNTVDELKEYTYNYLYDNALYSAMYNALLEKETVISYSESDFELLKNYSNESLAYYASMLQQYGYTDADEDTAAQMYGYDTAEAYTVAEAQHYLGLTMLFDKIAADLGIEVTDEEVDEEIAAYMDSYGYTDTYTVEEFKELSGDAWVMLIQKLQVEYRKVMEALRDNVVIIPAAEEETTEGSADDTSVETTEVSEEAASEAAAESVSEEAAQADETSAEEAAEETTTAK